ncbi:helix-turn-helix domain-containing protein [Streptomyces phaeochromogenes]|uniref:helix-turn-helix domain-containing protein n=1 Tax=Streptomyces phaeochromogenes TaxID=1923 RepID=UPI003713EF78
MSENPMFLRQRLREWLKKAREAAELTQQQVADTFGWSASKVIRIENGKIAVSVTDAMALAALYGLDSEKQRELVELARAARQPSWYTPYKEVMTKELEAYIAYEESARIVRAFERNVMPGLVQTEEYARALMRNLPDPTGEGHGGQLELRVDLRMKRQKVLESTDAQFFFILDESVLRRTIGNSAIMRQQRETLLRVSELPHVNIYYVPFTEGLYPLFRTPYQVFAIDDEEEDLVAYLEDAHGEAILSERAVRTTRNGLEPADYLDAFLEVERNGPARLISEDIVLGNSGA